MRCRFLDTKESVTERLGSSCSFTRALQNLCYDLVIFSFFIYFKTKTELILLSDQSHVSSTFVQVLRSMLSCGIALRNGV